MVTSHNIQRRQPQTLISCGVGFNHDRISLGTFALPCSPPRRCRYQEEKRNEDRRQMQVFRDWQVGADSIDNRYKYFACSRSSRQGVIVIGVSGRLFLVRGFSERRERVVGDMHVWR